MGKFILTFEMCRLHYFATLLLRTIAVSRTKLWKQKLSLPTGGYTFQISLNLLKRPPETLAVGMSPGPRLGEAGESREGQLIET